MTQFSFASTGLQVVQAFPEQVEGKTVVITGTSQGGIGAETAISLAHGKPKHLILAGRSEEKAKPVIEEIKKTDPKITSEFVNLDLGSQKSVRTAAAAINSSVQQIDILINNGAIMACPYAKTEDGIESQFATNYLGHFLLTNLLLGKIKAAPEARIVNVATSMNKFMTVDLDDYNFQNGETYHPIAGYGRSKLALILFSVSLTKRLEDTGITAFSLHPGNIKTGLQKHMADPKVMKDVLEYVKAQLGGKEFVREEFKTTQQGCSTTLVAALDPSLKAHSGSYLVNGNVAMDNLPALVEDPETTEKLWSLSERLVGLA